MATIKPSTRRIKRPSCSVSGLFSATPRSPLLRSASKRLAIRVRAAAEKAKKTSDTVVTAPPTDMEEQTTAQTGDGIKRRAASSTREQEAASVGQATPVVDPDQAVTIDASVSVSDGATPRSDADAKTLVAKPEPGQGAKADEASERQVAERRPTEARRSRKRSVRGPRGVPAECAGVA